jgi:hypothetical protein
MAGTYLVDGGRALFVIEHDWLRGLAVSEGSLQIMPGLPAKDMKVEASVTRREMVISEEQPDCFRYWNRAMNNRGENWRVNLSLDMYLVASPLANGDWDLVDTEFDADIDLPRGSYGQLLKAIPKEGLKVLQWKKEMRTHSTAMRTYNTMATYDRSDPPLKSFFHRLDDSRIREYFALRRKGNLDQQQRNLMKAILKDQPNDPYLQLHDIEMEALLGDTDLARRLLNEWKEANREDPVDPLHQAARIVTDTVSLACAIKSGYPPNSLREFFAGTANSPSTASLDARLDWLKHLLDYDYLSPETVPILAELGPTLWAGIPNFLEIQTLAKVSNVLATFDLLQGKREESLSLLAGTYRLGQSLNACPHLITRLIGMAIRGIAIGGLQVFILNACETPEDFELCWKMLDKLDQTPGQETGKYLLLGECASFEDATNRPRGRTPNLLEARTRQFVADARFHLVRTALAARYRLVTTGEFPKSEDDFAPFLASGLPQDVFALAPLKFTSAEPDLYSVYSVGPDRSDDGAAIEYDSTNGTTSRGDISIRIPRGREFPFPRDGVRTKNAYELLTQFPNGLPTDPFAKGEHGRLPLSIIESATGTPVIVFSVGPDQDHPGVPGSLVSTPPIAPDAARSRYEQSVFLPGKGIPNQDGYYHLGPRYDPTNGTTSDGDLSIEIPR